MIKKLSGLYTAPHTPYSPDGSVNPAAIELQVESLVENSIPGVFITGTTGESHLLSPEERKLAVETWAGASQDKLNIIAHVGTTCQETCIELAQHASKLNLAGIACMTPLFYKAKTVDDLLAYHKPIAEACGDTPFYFYDIPGFTHVDLPTHEYLKKAIDLFPNFAGLKFTRTDLYLFQNCRAVSDEINLFFGADELLMFGMLAGADGAIGSTYNYAAPVYNRVLAALKEGDTTKALKEQQGAVALVNVILKYDVMAAGKALMGMIGIDCGNPRLPNPQLSLQQKQQLYEELKHLDIFNKPLQRPT